MIDLSVEHMPAALVHRMTYILDLQKESIGDPANVMKYFDMCSMEYVKTRVAEMFS